MDILSMHAQSQPDKPAVICPDVGGDGEVVVTFAQLEERANRLAQ